MKKTCKTCEYFERNKWHKSIDSEEPYQLGGHCEVLDRVLCITNGFLWNERIHIQENFGCVFYKNKKKEYTCGFCGKPNTEAFHMIVNDAVDNGCCICGDCVQYCAKICEEKLIERKNKEKKQNDR